MGGTGVLAVSRPCPISRSHCAWLYARRRRLEGIHTRHTRCKSYPNVLACIQSPVCAGDGCAQQALGLGTGRKELLKATSFVHCPLCTAKGCTWQALKFVALHTRCILRACFAPRVHRFFEWDYSIPKITCVTKNIISL